ncbi:reverse transcriptase [Abeliophyllum distichum]|uniref:Reverse transcriptase n=1 Tax=Abeliophyllum distichum TaxID=126358 RepID=A0ABD1PD80_9LAMI
MCRNVRAEPAKVNNQANKGKAIVFAMTHEEAVQNSDVIMGMLSISSVPVYVLIDSGVTHSFISEVCLAKVNILCQKSDSVLEVSMPSGRTIETDKLAKAVQIDFDGLVFVSRPACYNY